jgi:nitrogen regulatory protein P-II 1
MKKLEIIIKPEKLEDLKAVLESSEVNGLNIVNSMGYGNQKGIIKNYRGASYNVTLLPKIKVETVVSDEVAPGLIDKVVDEINTGNFGDGKIFVYDVEDAVGLLQGGGSQHVAALGLVYIALAFLVDDIAVAARALAFVGASGIALGCGEGSQAQHQAETQQHGYKLLQENNLLL